MTAAEVTAPVIVVPGADDKLHYHYSGAIVDLNADDYERLIADGMVKAYEAETTAAPADADGDGDGGNGGSGDSPERPKQTAPKDAWVDYAVTRGIDKAEAEALTKPELISRLG